MTDFKLYSSSEKASFLIESSAYEGVSRIADAVREDISLVTGCKPERFCDPSKASGSIILAATIGKSQLLEKLSGSSKIDLSSVEGKRECYIRQVIENPFEEYPNIVSALVIAGSDKRGTIYGLFSISELCGVSPLVYFGDAEPEKRDNIVLSLESYTSKEPSVRYRGFFINDEWPAFGNWCNEHFGGVNAKAYDKIFELLLRLKGNYMWPAMWNSSFSDDGPGIENARLADMYGVVMGASHHEPMCRAGVEWQRICKNYGDSSAWSFISNEEAITKFWEDGIKRNKDFENVITIGMRGENDSKLLPENATLKDNIDVVKHAIEVQHRLIRENISSDLEKVPRMLAIYKEVEDYYYGNADCEGLKDWEELDDVIFLLCDDNFGNTRGLPELVSNKHKGGYGMYYHFDYHGAPVSYEWQNSSRITKTLEQLSQAYEFGVRDMWIVNVGDLKGVEYPLCCFMALAYDYETWGNFVPDTSEKFVDMWLTQQFGSMLTEEQRNDIKYVLDGYTKWNAVRRPEVMNPSIYHPTNFNEGDRVYNEVTDIISRAEMLKASLPESCMSAYLSMIYYPCVASLSLIAMHISAAKNELLASRGSLAANKYAEDVAMRIALDRQYVSEFHSLFDGKWNHMMDSAHTNFRSWDDHNWTYPAPRTVYPIPGGKIICGFNNSQRYSLGFHWQDGAPMVNSEMTDPNVSGIVINLDSRGDEEFEYKVTSDKEWLSFLPESGKVVPTTDGGVRIEAICDREHLLCEDKAIVTVFVTFASGRRTGCRLEVLAAAAPTEVEAPAFIESQGYISIDADHYQEKHDVDGEGWQAVKHLGRMGGAIKALPCTKSWIGEESAPWVAYDFIAASEGDYTAEIWLAPRNPVVKGSGMKYRVSVNDDKPVVINAVSDKYYTEWQDSEWNSGVMNNIRKNSCEVKVRKGLNRIYIYAGDPGVIVDKIVLHKADTKLPESYLGPNESYFAK